MSLGLSKSLRKTDGYSIGGVIGILAISTLLENKTAGFTVQRDPATKEVTGITPLGDNKFVIIDAEDATCLWADDLKVGANKYREHQVGFKFGDISDDTSEQMKALSLGKHTFLLLTKTDKAVLLGEKNGLTATTQKTGAGATNDDLAGSDLLLAGGEIVHAAVMPVDVFRTIAATVTV